ncbi:glycosyltransferase family 4 protein [Paraburkholderia atlantica]|uniref:glycosyltransferase family 4 protein n=1 Tax=Paraburkholderia atlantica TaxID=2654982 RepID=UPI003D25DF73
MKLVLALDALVPPLTGIGRYALELATHYQTTRNEFESMRFFFADRWVDDPADFLRAGAAGKTGKKRKGGLLRTPKWWRQWCLRREMRGHLFHSPNYFLPRTVEGGIVTVHDLSVFKYPETHPAERIKHFETSFLATLERVSHVITDSEATRREVIDYFGWSPERITSIALGVEEKFCQRAAPTIATELAKHGLAYGSYSLCVSTLEPRKRVDRLLAAYLDLPNPLRVRFPLVLAGSAGWLSDTLREQIAQGEREGWVRYMGFVDEAFLPLLYSGARAFLYPSVYEGFGLPVLEAMASGVPTLTSNSSSLPEVASGAAWLVEPDNHEQLRDGIVRVLCDDEWRQTAVARGLQVAGELTWKRCAERTLQLCRRFG